MESVPAATQVYLSMGRIADMGDSGILMAMAMGWYWDRQRDKEGWVGRRACGSAKP